MSNTEPTLTLPAVTVVSGNTTDFEICGNPNIKERVQIQSESEGTQVFMYGYVDVSTNTFIHSHLMTKKTGSFL